MAKHKKISHFDYFFIQYLAIYNNEHLLNTIKNGHSRFKILPNMKETL